MIDLDGIQLHHGDCREVLASLPDCSVDSVVTDPPYELGFMGKAWDGSGIAYSVEMWAEVLRVLKPGGHLCAFGGTRTYHRMACAIEDAGFEIRDSLHWVYGSGFPKSHNLEGEWEGWGTALKPAHEPIVLARRPLIGTVAANVLTHGTGALNIDGARVGTDETLGRAKGGWGNAAVGADNYGNFNSIGITKEGGRWPANVIFDTEAGALLDEQAEGASRFFTSIEWDDNTDLGIDVPFRYVPKPSKRERNAGLDGLPERSVGDKGNGLARRCATCSSSVIDGCECPDRTFINPTRTNHHPTVKALALMRWLVRLVTPPGGTVLEPFAGSGTTLMACVLEGFNGIGIEMTDEYLPIIEGRVKWAQAQPPRLDL
jgi:site-specific DNA-methyltransferase (adenine-specific)